MKRIKDKKKELNLPPKQNFLALGLFILFIFVVLCIYTCSQATAAGQVEIGMSYNSNTKREKNNFLAKIEEKKEDLEIEIDTNLYKEQEGEKLESLVINSDIQVNYYANENLFYFSKAGYNRNIEQGISDKTSVDFGMGHKDYTYKYPYRIQAGLSSRSIYYDQADLERDIFGNLAGDIKYSYKILDFKNESIFLMNLEKVRGTDIEVKNIAEIIANLGNNLFLSLSLDFSYFNHPHAGYPEEIKIWMIRGGFNF